jgi:two-component system cell cycle response regulator
MKKELKILLVEDNEGDERLIRELLREQKIISFNIDLASSLKVAEGKISGNKFDIILLDLGLPDSSGLETLIKLTTYSPNWLP